MNINQESGKGIIFGILGILTLIIAIMGASLAYFTAEGARGEKPIEVTAATVTITYTQGDVLTAEQLIPASETVARLAYERDDFDDNGEPMQCKDKKGYQVCSVFAFEASNEAGRSNQRIVGKITTTTDVTKNKDGREFRNLSFTVYKVGDEGVRTIVNTLPTTYGAVGTAAVNMFNNEDGTNDFEILAGEKQTFEIVTWLNEQSTDLENDDGSGNQDDEQGLSFSAEVQLSVSGASDKVTGTME